MPGIVKYCPKCHREAYRLVEEGENIKVIQGKGVLLNINKKSSVSMNLQCPSGHSVELKIGERDGTEKHSS